MADRDDALWNAYQQEWGEYDPPPASCGDVEPRAPRIDFGRPPTSYIQGAEEVTESGLVGAYHPDIYAGAWGDTPPAPGVDGRGDRPPLKRQNAMTQEEAAKWIEQKYPGFPATTSVGDPIMSSTAVKNAGVNVV